LNQRGDEYDDVRIRNNGRREPYRGEFQCGCHRKNCRAGHIIYTGSRRFRCRTDLTEVIERLKSGDQGALETIFNLYSVKLYNIALRILGEPADTEEVIQDVFLDRVSKSKIVSGQLPICHLALSFDRQCAPGKIRRRKNNKEVEYEEYLPKFQTDGHHSVAPGRRLVG
jgi:hypothetical protein